MKSLDECRLYCFVDTAYLGARDPGLVARQLCEGGADIIQLRAKDRTPAEVLALAREIHSITRSAGVPLVINDHLDIASRIGAEACHMGQEDFFDAGHSHVAAIRPANSLVRFGLSSHAPEQAMRAVAAGADYLGVGPVYATGTKPQARPVTLEYVGWAAQNLALPWFAIGGINLRNLDEVLAAGAKRICVVSAILSAPNIADQCRAFKAKLPA